MSTLLPAVLLLLAAAPAAAQDTIATGPAGKAHLDIDLRTGWYKQNSGPLNTVLIPEELPRRARNTSLRNAWNLNNEQLTDNPMQHGCVYLDLAMRARVGRYLTIHGDLIGEHRGFSGGLYTKDNLVVYPKLAIAYQQPVTLLKQRFDVHLSGGYRDSMRLMEGLTIYNMDVDNFTLFLQWRRFRYTYTTIGDLLFTGLNIDDQLNNIFSLEALPLGRTWKSDIRLAAIVNTGFNVYGHLDLSAGFYTGPNLRIYGQVSRRFPGSGPKSFAGLIGARYARRTNRLTLYTWLEGRYYGAGYNNNYLFEGV